MASMMCTVSLLLLCAALAVEVHPNWSLLTDFTADYTSASLGFLSLGPALGPAPGGNEAGTFHVNVLSGAMKVRANGSIDLPPPSKEMPFAAYLGPTVKGHGEFRLNVEKGFASVRARYEAVEALELCVKINLPPALLQNGLAQLKQALPAAEQQVQQTLAHAPKESGVVDGKSVATFSVGPEQNYASLSLLPNGVPVEFGVKGVFVTKFTNWHAGAGEIDEQDCHAVTASEFLATPGGMEMLGVLDRGMAALGTMSQYLHAGSMLSPQASVLVRHAAKEELAQMYADQSLSRASVTVAAGGVAGALLVATAVIAVLKPSRRLLEEPLISTAA